VAAPDEQNRRGVGRAAVVLFAGAAIAGIAIAVEPPSGVDRAPAPPELAALDVPELEPTRRAGRRRPRDRPPDRPVPSADAVRAAAVYAEERGGLVSFAVVDSEGRLRGRDADRLFSAASIVKAMVLAAELHRLADEHAHVDTSTASLLEAMITYSDNEAADTIYARVGDEGMHAVAERAGMKGFEIAGHWGNAQVTAADMARFFADLDRMLPARHREYGRTLLASIMESQRWGIPEAAGDRWGVRFKGGWLPEKALVHQAAELRSRSGPEQISLAILTDEQPSYGYGIETVRGVADRLLAGPTPTRRRPGRPSSRAGSGS
jgi:hypothetical protein